MKGSDLQVHPKLPQTGSGGWTSLERCRGGEGEGEREKKLKVRVKGACGTICFFLFYTARQFKSALNGRRESANTGRGKVEPSCSSATTRASIIGSRKRFSSPKLGVEGGGGGCC